METETETEPLPELRQPRQRREPEAAGEPGVPELATQGELLARIAAQLIAPRRARA